jgi:hypothetical protein
MTLADFHRTLDSPAPPAGISAPLLALWHDARGDWDRAHGIAQDLDDETGARIHAYLHRKEGDASNAAYWYRRAGRSAERGDLDEEWAGLVEELLRQ